MKECKEYLMYDEALVSPAEKEDLKRLLGEYRLDGTEFYMNEAAPRTELLFRNEEEKRACRERFEKLGLKRVHCSYWAYPTYFLTKSHYRELVNRIGGEEEVRAYYGDLAGNHLFERWSQEYELACMLGAQAYTFHLIDYAVIDGAWDFDITREEILQAMIGMLQRFLVYLEEKGLMDDASPVIELENAGWGLEYGAQRHEDFEEVFAQLYDPYDKVRVAWDINHLLHAAGLHPETGKACFMLQDFEITPWMRGLEKNYADDPGAFAMNWLRANILAEGLRGKVNCLHVSDCFLKTTEYFRNGRLQGIYGEEIDKRVGRESKEEYGLAIVLGKYDSHVPLGTDGGVVNCKELMEMIRQLKRDNPEFVILHELKNSKPLFGDLRRQMENLHG